MSVYQFLILVMYMILLFSCKKEKMVTENTKIEIQLKTSQPIDFSLYYKLDSLADFNEDQRIHFKISKSDTWTKAMFELPTKDLPTQLMFNFGRDSLLTDIQLKDFQLNALNKTIEFENDDLHLFFKYYEFLTYQGEGKYLVFPENGEFNPYLKTTPFFTQRLKLVY